MKRSERRSMDKQKKKLLEEDVYIRLHYFVIRPIIAIVAEYLHFK